VGVGQDRIEAGWCLPLRCAALQRNSVWLWSEKECLGVWLSEGAVLSADSHCCCGHGLGIDGCVSWHPSSVRRQSLYESNKAGVLLPHKVFHFSRPCVRPVDHLSTYHTPNEQKGKKSLDGFVPSM